MSVCTLLWPNDAPPSCETAASTLVKMFAGSSRRSDQATYTLLCLSTWTDGNTWLVIPGSSFTLTGASHDVPPSTDLLTRMSAPLDVAPMGVFPLKYVSYSTAALFGSTLMYGAFRICERPRLYPSG